MATDPQKCPKCGAPASGKFCAECGAPLGAATCRACGAKLSARARFCPECGAPAAGGAAAAAPPAPAAARPSGERLSWYIAGVSVLALLVVIVVLVARKAGPPAAPEAAAAAGAAGAMPGGVRATTDLSTMTPRQAADMLYNKIMTLNEAGQTDSVNFFAPMALQAYANLGDLDPDGRLHVGLIELAIGDAGAAAAQADTILRAHPTHLFGWLLRARSAAAQGNVTAERSADRSFLTNYDAELAKKRPEYQEHAQMLQEERTRAEQARRGGAGGGAAR
jgi:Double zinc ribbon